MADACDVDARVARVGMVAVDEEDERREEEGREGGGQAKGAVGLWMIRRRNGKFLPGGG